MGATFGNGPSDNIWEGKKHEKFGVILDNFHRKYIYGTDRQNENRKSALSTTYHP